MQIRIILDGGFISTFKNFRVFSRKILNVILYHEEETFSADGANFHFFLLCEL